MSPALGTEIYACGFRFNPTPQEAVTYYLPRLVSGDPRALHDVVRPVIHHAEVYACDPAELACRFRPMPRTHNRFFFTVIKKGVRAAGSGSWAGQSTVEIKDKDVQIGELRKFRYKKRGGVFTDWLMEEYSSCGFDGAGGGGMQPVLCKVYVSPKAAPNSDAYQESAACFTTPPPTAPAVITQPVATKRPAPPHDAMPRCAKRMRGPTALQPPPQPCAPRRGSATQPSPASALPLAPEAPNRPPLAAVQKMSFACAPCRGSTTQPLPASALPLAPPVPTRPAVQPHGSPMPLPTPPRPLAQPKQQQVQLPTPPVVRACHMPQEALAPHCRPQVSVQPKQRRTILDPFESAMLRARADTEEQTVAAAPATLRDDDDDDDDFAKVMEDMLSAEAEEQTAVAAPATLQDDDDDFANVMEDMLSDEAEEPALDFDVDTFFNFSEEDLEVA